MEEEEATIGPKGHTPEGVEAHPGFEAVSVAPDNRHLLAKGEVEDGNEGAGEDRGSLVGEIAGLNDEPGEGVRDKHERVEEAGEMEGLEGAGIGRRDD